jgi:hypothetical protein
VTELTYIVGGAVVDADTLKAAASQQRKPKPKREAPDSFHRGYSVEGHPPGYPEECQRIAEACWADWQSQTEQQKARRIKDGERPPKPWDFNRWLLTTKRKKARSKPYELLSAAEECKAIAERTGWTHVQIVELKKQGQQQREFAA